MEPGQSSLKLFSPNSRKDREQEIFIFRFTGDTLALTVFPENYLGRLVENCMLKIYSMIKVKETNQIWSEEDDFVLEKPKLEVKIEEARLERNRLGHVRVRFQNPLDVPLTLCKLRIEGNGGFKDLKEKVLYIMSFSFKVLSFGLLF